MTKQQRSWFARHKILTTIGALIMFFIVVGIAAGDGEDNSGSGTVASEPDANAKTAEEEPEPEQTPVKLTAKKADFAKSVLADSSDYTSVTVTVANDSDEKIDVNPLYFTITDTDGTKHTAELGIDDNQLETVDLTPGENISGTITGKGTFTPKYVTYTNGLFSNDPLRADVS